MKIIISSSLEKKTSTARTRGCRGILLIDCITYIGLFFLLLVIAFKLFYACWDNAKSVRRNSDEIVATLKAGERWRDEVRHASSPVLTEDTTSGLVWRIPQKATEIAYKMADKALWRREGSNGEWTVILPRIKSSRMEKEARQHVTAWRWEVELDAHRKGARVLPRFTFEAVPPALIP